MMPPKKYVLTAEDRVHINGWAICNQNRLFKIRNREVTPWGLTWTGETLDGFAAASREPVFLTDEDSRLLDELQDYKFRYESLEY